MIDLQKLSTNVSHKLIVAKGFKILPKVQKIAQSGHTGNSLLPRLGFRWTSLVG